jgi:hypothetical protein
MKANKFGKLQKLILMNVAESREKGSLLPALHKLAFPGDSYPLSYVTPVLLRMEHQQLIKVAWNRVDIQLSRVYLKGKRHGPKIVRGVKDPVYTRYSSPGGRGGKGAGLVNEPRSK